jgi:hypothetical protein
MKAFRGLSGILLVTAFAFGALFPATPALAQIRLTKTVGLEPDVCASDNFITVPTETTVFYCYCLENIGDSTRSVHFLEDDRVGILLESDSFDIAPGEVFSVTAAFFVENDVVNNATWTADEEFTDSASATVLIRNFPCPGSLRDIVRNGSFEDLDSFGDPLAWNLDPGAVTDTFNARTGLFSVGIFSPTATLRQRIISPEAGTVQISWYQRNPTKGAPIPYALVTLPSFSVGQGAFIDVQIGPLSETVLGPVFIDDVAVLFCPETSPTPTATPTPTETPTSTFTPTETETPMPTLTFTPTLTPTHTPTSTPTFTNTSVPTRTPPPPGDVVIVSPQDQGVYTEGDPIDFEWIRDEAGLIHLIVMSRLVSGAPMAIGGGVFTGDDLDMFVQALPAGAYICSATALNLTLDVVFSADEVRFFVNSKSSGTPLLDLDLSGRVDANDLLYLLSEVVEKAPFRDQGDLLYFSALWLTETQKSVLSDRAPPD